MCPFPVCHPVHLLSTTDDWNLILETNKNSIFSDIKVSVEPKHVKDMKWKEGIVLLKEKIVFGLGKDNPI